MFFKRKNFSGSCIEGFLVIDSFEGVRSQSLCICYIFSSLSHLCAFTLRYRILSSQCIFLQGTLKYLYLTLEPSLLSICDAGSDYTSPSSQDQPIEGARGVLWGWNGKQEVGSREQEAGSEKQEAGSRKWKEWSRKQEPFPFGAVPQFLIHLWLSPAIFFIPH